METNKSKQLLKEADIFGMYIAVELVSWLTKPWTDWAAYKLGIIDKDGNTLKKSNQLKTSQERSAWTEVHRIIRNLRKAIELLPFGKSRLGSWAASFWLLKEELKSVSKDELESIGWAAYNKTGGKITINETFELANDINELKAGYYRFTESDETQGITEDDVIELEEDIKPVGHFFGLNIFKVPFKNKEVITTSINLMYI